VFLGDRRQTLGGKLFVALQLEALHHFIEKFARGRSRRLKPPGFVTVVFFRPETQLTVNTSTLLLKECRPSANGERAATIPLIAFFLAG
jgi:hypothetical protein